ncbi:MAG: hypothetical protein ABSH41_28890 [Syntrophobacteraceae bacterium]|jgi:hypothetical protein
MSKEKSIASNQFDIGEAFEQFMNGTGLSSQETVASRQVHGNIVPYIVSYY